MWPRLALSLLLVQDDLRLLSLFPEGSDDRLMALMPGGETWLVEGLPECELGLNLSSP